MKKFLFGLILSLPGLLAALQPCDDPKAIPPAAESKGGYDDFVASQVKPQPKDKHGRGFKLPPKAVRDQMHRVSEAKYGAIRKAIPVATQTVYDARVLGIIPPVGNQGQCGNCYMWSGCKVCSSAQMAAKVMPQDGKFMLAPSYGLDCHSDLGGCNGGDEYQVAQLIQSSGWPSLAQYGGDGQNPGRCKPTTGMTLYTVSSVVMVGSQSGIAATQDIKNYLAVYGYVSVAGDASTDWWNNGTGTDVGTGTSIDHAIGLVGWDDGHDNGDGSKGAWVMQNNWDTSWGTNCANTANPTPTESGGYGWMKYGADSIGTEAFVAIAASGPVPPTPPTPPTPPVPGTKTITQIVATFSDGSTQTLSGTPSGGGITVTPQTTLQQLIDALQPAKPTNPVPDMPLTPMKP